MVSDTVAKAFNKSMAIRALAFDIYKIFDRIWHAGLLAQPLLNSGQIFAFILSFLGNKHLWEALHGKSSQEYPMPEFLKAPFLVAHFSYSTLGQA